MYIYIYFFIIIIFLTLFIPLHTTKATKAIYTHVYKICEHVTLKQKRTEEKK